MSTNRRNFLQISAAAAGAAALNGVLPDALAGAMHVAPIEPAPRALRILILGGTGFTGPHQVQYAVARGHHVTVFNRGRRQADLPKSVEHLVGDRTTPQAMDSVKAAIAKGAKWDVVIDNPTTLPSWVRDAGAALKDATSHFIFISTISTYADTSKAGMDETTAQLPYEGPDAFAETTTGSLYGQLKTVSEKEAMKWFPGRATVIRPGLIVGPGDTTGRFTYWPVRIEKGGEILAPGDGRDNAQVIDARDLAEWTIRVAENKTFGIFNATGPAGNMTMAEMLGGVRAAFDGTKPTKFTWVPADFLAAQQPPVRGWSEMPVWVAVTPERLGFLNVSVARAVAAGLTFRPLAVTARDTAAWVKTLPTIQWYKDMTPAQQTRVHGAMTAEREAAVLDAWHKRT